MTPPGQLRTDRPQAVASPSAEMARGSVLSLGGSMTSAVMGLLVVIVLGNHLGDAGAGVVLQVIAIFTIALALARFGMDSAMLWLLPRLSDDNPAALRRAVLIAVAVAGAAGAICGLVLTAVAGIFGARLSQDGVADALAATAWALPLAAMMLTGLAASRALGGVAAYVLIGSVGLPVSRVVLVALAASLGLSTSGIAIWWAIPLAFAFAASAVVVTRQLRAPATSVRHDASAPPTTATLRHRIIRFGLPRVASALLEQLLLWLDVVVVGIIAGPAAAGIYGAASRFVLAGMVVDTAVRVVVSPSFSRLSHRGDTAGIAEVFRTATSWLVLFSTPVYLLLAIFAPVPLSLLGPEFAAGEPVVLILCLGAVVTFLAGNVHSVLLMSGRSGLAAQNKAIAVGTNVALLVLLVPHWGVTGAAVAWASATLLDALMASVQVRTVLRLPLPLSSGVRPLAVALLTVGVPALTCRLLLGATWLSLGVAGVVGLAALTTWARRTPHSLRLDAFAALLSSRSKEVAP